MEVFNGSWEAIAQGRADIVIGATAAVPVGGDFEVRDMGILDWAFVMSPNHPCVREQNLSEEFISQFLAICLDDTSSVLPNAIPNTTLNSAVCCCLTGTVRLKV